MVCFLTVLKVTVLLLLGCFTVLLPITEFQVCPSPDKESWRTLWDKRVWRGHHPTFSGSFTVSSESTWKLSTVLHTTGCYNQVSQTKWVRYQRCILSKIWRFKTKLGTRGPCILPQSQDVCILHCSRSKFPAHLSGLLHLYPKVPSVTRRKMQCACFQDSPSSPAKLCGISTVQHCCDLISF